VRFLFTTLCTSIQRFGEKCSQRSVDRLKISATALKSAAGAPGTLPARSAPRAVLRQSHPPRRACGLFPTAWRSGPWSPSRLLSLDASRLYCVVPRRIARRSVVRFPVMRGCLGRRRTGAVKAGTSFASRARGAAGYLGRCCPAQAGAACCPVQARRSCRPGSPPASFGTPTFPSLAKHPSSPTRPPQLPYTTAPASQAASSPDRAIPRPCRLGAGGQPPTSAPPPV
jgi:hypothetical protein